MGKRWSKLQARLYNLMDPAVNFQIHCALYEMKSLGHYGSRLSRYFITVDKEIVFDYPKDMELDKKYIYLWNSDVDKISNLIEEYIQRPKEELFEDFPNDKWGIVDILCACDRPTCGGRRGGTRKYWKMQANRKVRKERTLRNKSKNYKKIYEIWNIRDYRFYERKPTEIDGD